MTTARGWSSPRNLQDSPGSPRDRHRNSGSPGRRSCAPPQCRRETGRRPGPARPARGPQRSPQRSAKCRGRVPVVGPGARRVGRLFPRHRQHAGPKDSDETIIFPIRLSILTRPRHPPIRFSVRETRIRTIVAPLPQRDVAPGRPDHDGARGAEATPAEVVELKRANEILKKAAAFFAQAELDRRAK